jgi:phosphatidylinositol glycan class W
MQPQQQPQQQQSLQQQRQEPSSSSSISGGPMRLMLAFNRNMLALFLIANLLTGAVNLSVNTLAVGSWTARAIVGEWGLRVGVRWLGASLNGGGACSSTCGPAS